MTKGATQTADIGLGLKALRSRVGDRVGGSRHGHHRDGETEYQVQEQIYSCRGLMYKKDGKLSHWRTDSLLTNSAETTAYPWWKIRTLDLTSCHIDYLKMNHRPKVKLDTIHGSQSQEEWEPAMARGFIPAAELHTSPQKVR